jgi:hypothetical protein
VKEGAVNVVNRILIVGSAAACLVGLGACASLGQREASDENLPAVSLGYGTESDAALGEADDSSRDLVDVLGPAERRVYYQYVDDDFVVHFTENLLAVPEEWRGRAGRIELDVRPPLTPPEARMIRKLRLEREEEAESF